MFLDYLNMVDNSTETKSSNLNARESRIIQNTMGDKTTGESGAITKICRAIFIQALVQNSGWRDRYICDRYGDRTGY